MKKETYLTKDEAQTMIMKVGGEPENALEYLHGLEEWIDGKEMYKLSDIERFINR